jgi:hypothetical protein
LTLLLSGQFPGQRLVATDTSFARQKDLAFSGGSNCPLAVDHANARVYFSADVLTSIDLRSGALQQHDAGTDLSASWMLEYRPRQSDLLMLLHGPELKAHCLGAFDLGTDRLRTLPLPDDVFFPLAIDHTRGVALFSARQAGAALCDLSGSTVALSSIRLPHFAMGGCFIDDGSKVILGGDGLYGWDLGSGSVSPLCKTGRYPVPDRNGDIWFCTEDGNLCRLRRDGSGFDTIVELAGVDPRGWGYSQPVVFSPDGRYGLARLTGKTALTGPELAEAEEFCRRHGQDFSDRHRHR